MLLMKDLGSHQETLVNMISFARDHGEIGIDKPEVNEFLDLLDEANKRPLSRAALDRLTVLTRKIVILPIYTLVQAAAWLGVTVDALRHAIWKADPPLIQSFKSGHDRLITHRELARYAAERRYGGQN